MQIHPQLIVYFTPYSWVVLVPPSNAQNVLHSEPWLVWSDRSCADFTRSITLCSCHVVHGSEPDLPLILSSRNGENCQRDSFTASCLEHDPWSYKVRNCQIILPIWLYPSVRDPILYCSTPRNRRRNLSLFPCTICSLMGYSQYYHQKRTWFITAC